MPYSGAIAGDFSATDYRNTIIRRFLKGSSLISEIKVSKNAILKKIENDSLSEEMRVLYVAMTRARDRLIMTYASANLEKDIAELRAIFEDKED